MIGGTFEYLLSSLPNLSFQNSDEIKGQVFNLLQKYAGKSNEKLSLIQILDKEAEKFLPRSTFDTFQKINLKNIHQPEFQNHKIKTLSAFSTFTFELKKAIEIWRLSQREGEDKNAGNRVKKLIGDGSPLEKEIQIMKYQWDKLEEFSVGNFANAESLFTYKIKLMILLRWWSFDQKQGYENFKQLTINN